LLIRFDIINILPYHRDMSKINNGIILKVIFKRKIHKLPKYSLTPY
jgi:hypothetical protein